MKPYLRTFSRHSIPGKLLIFPRKSLGQNFLVDPRITAKIIAACDFRRDETALEIGPGKGALTTLIAPSVGRLILIEKDERFCAQLRKDFPGPSVEIVHADFLKWDLNNLPQGIKVVGNLPYYITTPIITRVLENREKFRQLFITVQWEVGQRLLAVPRTKEYSAFGCFVRYYADCKLLFKIKRTCFRPMPKVDSCFMKMEIPIEPKFPGVDEKRLFQIIYGAFGQRRKTISNALSPFMDKEKLAPLLEQAGISREARPDQLALEEYVRLVRLLTID